MSDAEAREQTVAGKAHLSPFQPGVSPTLRRRASPRRHSSGMSAAVVSLLSTRHFSLQSERELSGRAATSSSRRHPHSRSARVQVHARLDAGDDGEEPDAESEGPSKRARQNARRRERQREKTARAEAKKSKEKLQALAKELEVSMR